MSEYFVLTGPGRTGTRFLAHHLGKGKGVVVRHDEFLPICYDKAFERWRRGGPPIIGAVSGTARYYIKQIYEEFQPKVVFLWRDPVALVRSHAEMQVKAMNPARDADGCALWPFPHETPPMYLRRTASILLGDLEASLALCAKYEIPVHHALMDKYITREGLVEMAAFLGFEIEPHGLKPVNTMPFYNSVIKRTDFDEETTKHIGALVTSLDRVRNGYSTASRPGCVNSDSAPRKMD
jgi:hypothetical protein